MIASIEQLELLVAALDGLGCDGQPRAIAIHPSLALSLRQPEAKPLHEALGVTVYTSARLPLDTAFAGTEAEMGEMIERAESQPLSFVDEQ